MDFDWLLAGATIAGPILAVQAQRIVDRARKPQDTKDWIFAMLMAYRNARTASDPVRALNAIDVAFYGRRWWLIGRLQSANERAVVAAYRRWHEFVTVDPMTPGDPRIKDWNVRSNELFVALLGAIAKERDYDLNPEILGHGGYYPKVAGDADAQQTELRTALLQTFSGGKPIPIAVSAAPPPTPGTQVEHR